MDRKIRELKPDEVKVIVSGLSAAESAMIAAAMRPVPATEFRRRW